MDNLLIVKFMVICIFVVLCILGIMKYFEIKLMKNIIENEKAQMSLINALIGGVQKNFDQGLKKIENQQIQNIGKVEENSKRGKNRKKKNNVDDQARREAKEI